MESLVPSSCAEGGVDVPQEAGRVTTSCRGGWGKRPRLRGPMEEVETSWKKAKTRTGKKLLRSSRASQLDCHCVHALQDRDGLGAVYAGRDVMMVGGTTRVGPLPKWTSATASPLNLDEKKVWKSMRSMEVEFAFEWGRDSGTGY